MSCNLFKSIETPTSFDHVEFLNFPTQKFIVLPSHHIKLEVTPLWLLPPTHHNGPSLNGWSPSLNRQSPPSTECFLPPSIHSWSPPSLNAQSASSLNEQPLPSLDKQPLASLDAWLPPSLDTWPPPLMNVSQQMPLPYSLLPPSMDGWPPPLTNSLLS